MTAMAPQVTPESTRSLVLVNVATLVLALGFGWPLATLMWPYLLQSLVIGYYSRRRMLALTEFSTEGVKENNRPVPPTVETRNRMANFFTLHFGFFHLGYALFLWQRVGEMAWWDWAGCAVAALSFAFNHRLSYEQNVAADRRGRPNIGKLMILPYARILPMHITILLGWAWEGPVAVLLFGGLKTVADVIMHKVEHRSLQRGASAATAGVAAPDT